MKSVFKSESTIKLCNLLKGELPSVSFLNLNAHAIFIQLESALDIPLMLHLNIRMMETLFNQQFYQRVPL